MKKLLPFLAVAIASPTFAATCESLASLALPDTTITSAQIVPAGQFTQPGAAGKVQRPCEAALARRRDTRLRSRRSRRRTLTVACPVFGLNRGVGSVSA